MVRVRSVAAPIMIDIAAGLSSCLSWRLTQVKTKNTRESATSAFGMADILAGPEHCQLLADASLASISAAYERRKPVQVTGQ